MINKNNFWITNKFTISLIFILAFSRLIPHPPNFTPVIAVAIMSSYFFRNIYISLITLFLSMFLSDIFVGFYKHIIFVYLALFLINYIFFKFSKKVNYKNLFVFGFLGSIIFFLISNFGVWMLGNLYEKNFNGLITCYVTAIPFFTNTLISTIFFIYSAFFIEKKYLKVFS